MNCYDKEVNIKDVRLIKKAALAPMAGVTDQAFRRQCAHFGAAYTVSEMVSAKALTYHDAKTARIMTPFDGETPYSVQIFGSDPGICANGAAIAAEMARPQMIDINMGCPAPKVTSNGEGSALMKNIPLAYKIIEAVVKAVELPVTVKFRKGWDSENTTAIELALAAECAGAAAITVHGRTRTMMYSGSADREIIAAVKSAVNIPVIANGDVFSARDALEMLSDTGADMVMVARGCMGRPWIFAEINALLERGELLPEPTLDEKMRLLIEQTTDAALYKGERTACKEARKHAAWYLKGIHGAGQLRGQANKVTTIDELTEWARIVRTTAGTY